jgi:copper chaperone CopZ
VLSAVLLGVAASACCWLPSALVSLGLATGTLGARIAWIRPWALAIMALLLCGVIVWWVLKRYGGPSGKDTCCTEPPRFPTLPVVALGLSALGAAAVPRLIHPGQSATLSSPAPTGGTLLVLSTPQFDCPACVGTLSQAMAATPGVVSVQMDFDKRETRIVFQPGSAVDATLARWKQELGFEGIEVKRETASTLSSGTIELK